MKILKKFVLMFLALTVCLSCSFGCSRPNNTVVVDNKKTQLYVFNYNGGVGHAWLDSIIKKFEEAYSDYSFQEGKVGVQVFPTNEKNSTWIGETLITRLNSLTEEVFFTESTVYTDLVKSGKVRDITNAVTTNLNEYGESGSIVDKLPESQKDYYKVDNKYYALPFYEGYIGMFYDADLFSDKNLYISKSSPVDGMGKTVFVESKSDVKSVGPDGQAGTYDDGLPRTYNEFFNLLKEMKLNAGISQPITFPGIAPEYVYMLGAAMANDFDGATDAMVNYTFNGTATLIDGEIPNSFTYGNVATKEETITEGNGYLLGKRVSNLYALDFLNTFMEKAGSYFSNNCLSDTYSHVESQTDFINSKYSNNKTGILIDGSWWESESTEIFNKLSNKPKSGKNQRNFAFMPYPRPTVDDNYKMTLTSVFSPVVFIRNNIAQDKVEVAETFLRFCHTNAALEEFTQITSVFRGFNYSITDESKLSNYAKSLWNYRKNSDVIYQLSKSTIFSLEGTAHSTPYALEGRNGVMTVLPTTAFRVDKDNISTKKMLEYVINRRNKLWENYRSLGII